MQQPQQQPALAPRTQTNARLCLLGDLGNSLLVLQPYTHGRESSSKGAVFTHPCSMYMGHAPVQTHTSGTELCQGQICSLSALARFPPSFHKSSPSLTVSASLQQNHSSPSLSSHPALREMHSCICLHVHSPFFLSFKALRFSFCLTHPFMLHFPLSATRPLCPQVDPDCLPSTMQAASPSPSDRRTPTNLLNPSTRL